MFIFYVFVDGSTKETHRFPRLQLICCKIVKRIFMTCYERWVISYSFCDLSSCQCSDIKKIQSMDLKKNIPSEIKGNLNVHLSCIIVNVTVVM